MAPSVEGLGEAKARHCAEIPESFNFDETTSADGANGDDFKIGTATLRRHYRVHARRYGSCYRRFRSTENEKRPAIPLEIATIFTKSVVGSHSDMALTGQF